jgi:hypothetical protein
MFIISLTYKCELEEVDKHLDAHDPIVMKQDFSTDSSGY